MTGFSTTLSRPRILCIDDDEIILDIYQLLLGDVGDLQCVSSGEAGLAVLKRFNPAMVLLDVNMPGGMDGYETCRRIKQLTHGALPVIFISSLASAEERLRGYAVGGDDYVPKPFDLEELRYKIDSMLQQLQRLASIEAHTRHAITERDEQLVMLELMESAVQAESPELLADNLLRTLSCYRLQATVELSAGKSRVFSSTCGEPGPLEQAALGYIRTHGDLQATETRELFHAQGVSLLVNNKAQVELPTWQRLSSYLSLSVRVVSQRLQALVLFDSLMRQRELALRTQQQAQRLQHRLQTDHKSVREGVRDSLALMGHKLEAAYYSLALSREQELMISEIVENNECIVNNLLQTEPTLDECLNGSLHSLVNEV